MSPGLRTFDPVPGASVPAPDPAEPSLYIEKAWCLTPEEGAELRQVLAGERLDAAYQEWLRHDRVRRIWMRELQGIMELAQALPTIGGPPCQLWERLQGLGEALAGDWIQSPRDMAERHGRRVAPVVGIARA